MISLLISFEKNIEQFFHVICREYCTSYFLKPQFKASKMAMPGYKTEKLLFMHRNDETVALSHKYQTPIEGSQDCEELPTS